MRVKCSVLRDKGEAMSSFELRKEKLTFKEALFLLWAYRVAGHASAGV